MVSVNCDELLETCVRMADEIHGARTGMFPGPDTGVIRVAAVPAELNQTRDLEWELWVVLSHDKLLKV